MRQFLEQLFNSGRVTVPAPGGPFDGGESLHDAILPFDEAARLSLAGRPPDLDFVVAEWAARLLGDAARLTVSRDVGAEAIAAVFTPCPKPRSSDTDYSADLFLRYLPSLLEIVRRIAPGDPLADQLRVVLAEWPLSSVGVQDLAIGSIEPFFPHPSLRQLYVDRILAAEDVSRLNDPRVSDAVRAAIGAHPELAPKVAHAAGIVAETRK